MTTKLLTSLLLWSAIGTVNAEPTSSPLSIAYLRPYGGGNTVFLGANISPGSFCASNIFSMDISTNAGKAMYAGALVALTSGKLVKLELLTCAVGPNDVSQLQSLYVLP